MTKIVAGLVLALSCGLFSCTSTDTSASGEPNVVDVSVGGASNAFSPPTVTIKVGQTVRWTWMGGTHNVVSGSDCATSDGNFRSGAPQAGGTYDHIFEVAGSFPYHCEPHCDMGMTGTVIVQ